MKYKGLLLTFAGIIVAIILTRTEFFPEFIISLTRFGYLGALIIGVFFVSSFTVTIALVALCYLAGVQQIYLVAIFAGLGAVIGDLLLFQFVKDNLSKELTALLDTIPYFRKRHLIKILKNHHLTWFAPVVGAIIVASPFPDEIGVSLMGLSKIKTHRFVLISYVLNTVGILILLVWGSNTTIK